MRKDNKKWRINELDKKGITGSTLKIIAIVTMLIDHIGAGVLGRYLVMKGINEVSLHKSLEGELWLDANAKLYYTYMIFRLIGRIAFPIFCFLLVEGFMHTKNKWKYAIRLGIFMLISEIPFDKLFFGKIIHLQYQNVFFTLFIGLLTMIAVESISKIKAFKPITHKVAVITIVIVGMIIAKLLRTDYDAIGIFCILILYFNRENKKNQVIVGSLSFIWEITAPLAFIPIKFYNGKRGLQMKYLFYFFYPVHLIILYFVCVMLNINNYASY